MSFARVLSLATVWFLLQIALFSSLARAGNDWPAGFKLVEDSSSPNGRYGVLIPTKSATEEADNEGIKNTLVDLKSHRRIAVIRGAHSVPGQLQHSLEVTWAPDSSWCAVVYRARWGFESITLVEPHGVKCTQLDLEDRVQQTLNAEIDRQAGEKMGGYGAVYFRAGPGRTVLVRAYAEAHPRKTDSEDDYRAAFQGTFDLATGKWTRAEALKILHCEPYEVAYNSPLGETLNFPKDEDKLAWFNEQLRLVLEAVQTVLPEKRFAEVNEQQTAWWKQVEALGSIDEKCKSIGARIRELRELVWQ